MENFKQISLTREVREWRNMGNYALLPFILLLQCIYRKSVSKNLRCGTALKAALILKIRGHFIYPFS